MSTETLKNRKDAFISALAALRKAGNDVSDAAIGFIAAIESHGILSNQDTEEISKFSVAFSNSKQALESPKPVEAKEEAKPKRKKRVSDPNQPKRPLPVVLEYLNAEKKRIRESYAAKSEAVPEPSELNTQAQQAWASLDEGEKSKLNKLQEDRVAKYQKELADYKSKKAAGELPDAEDAKPEAKEEQESPKKRKTKESKESKDIKDASPEKKKRKKKSKDSKDDE